MEKYKITDLYIAAFLRAIGYSNEVEVKNWRCHFLFDQEARDDVNDLMNNKEFNVKWLDLINEIKQLKAYVNNL